MPKADIEDLIPECVELDTFDDRWAFVAVAMVQTRGLRPKGMLSFLGNDFFLIGYRVFVRYTDVNGKSLRGLFILRSETNRKKMELFGNVFTHYNYTTTDIDVRRSGDVTEVSSTSSAFKVVIHEPADAEIGLPASSPFANWQQARKFAGPLPNTFTYDPSTKAVLIIEGVRKNWKPTPVEVVEHHFRFLDELNLTDVRLANAFIIRNVPYSWKRGRKEIWKPK